MKTIFGYRSNGLAFYIAIFQLQNHNLIMFSTSNVSNFKLTNLKLEQNRQLRCLTTIHIPKRGYRFNRHFILFLFMPICGCIMSLSFGLFCFCKYILLSV